MTDTTNSPLEGNVLFYTNPEPLDPSLHGGAGRQSGDKPYAFVGQTNVVPLTVTEFAAAALSYPVIFTGDNRQPVVVMGLRQREPVRRGRRRVPSRRLYPGLCAPLSVRLRRRQAEPAPDPVHRPRRLDRAEGGQNPLFVNGQASDYTTMAMEFCNNFEQERQRTEAFVKLIKDLDLLDVREAVFTPRNPDGTPGAPQKLAEYYAVSEDKLRALPAEKLAELRDNGALGQIYAHLVSLLGWDRLIALAFLRPGPGLGQLRPAVDDRSTPRRFAGGAFVVSAAREQRPGQAGKDQTPASSSRSCEAMTMPLSSPTGSLPITVMRPAQQFARRGIAHVTQPIDGQDLGLGPAAGLVGRETAPQGVDHGVRRAIGGVPARREPLDEDVQRPRSTAQAPSGTTCPTSRSSKWTCSGSLMRDLGFRRVLRKREPAACRRDRR
jgi:hypothetical protein